MSKIERVRSYAFMIGHPERDTSEGFLYDMAYNLALEIEVVVEILDNLCVGYKEVLDGDYDRVNLALERLDEWNNSNGE